MTTTGAMNVAMFCILPRGFQRRRSVFVGALISMTLYTRHVRASHWARAVGCGSHHLLIVAIVVERWYQLDDDDEQPPSTVLEQKAGNQ